MRTDVTLPISLSRSLPMWAVLCVSCVGTNPDWDEPPVAGSTGEIAASETSSRSPAEDDDSGSGTGAGSLPTGTSPGAEDDACLESGLARCEDETTTICVDLAVDLHHCGACFHDCTEIAGSTCIDGACACPEGEWWAVCNGVCREVKDDPQACGHGCVDCTRLDGEDPRCKNGVCEFDD